MKKELTLLFCSILLLTSCSENTSRSTAPKVSDPVVETTSATQTTTDKNLSTVTITTAIEEQFTSVASDVVTTTVDLKNNQVNAETNSVDQETESPEQVSETVTENETSQERINDDGDMIIYQTTAQTVHKPSGTTTTISNAEKSTTIVTEGAIELPFIPAE